MAPETASVPRARPPCAEDVTLSMPLGLRALGLQPCSREVRAPCCHRTGRRSQWGGHLVTPSGSRQLHPEPGPVERQG